MSEEEKTQVYRGVISLVQQGRSLKELKGNCRSQRDWQGHML